LISQDGQFFFPNKKGPGLAVVLAFVQYTSELFYSKFNAKQENAHQCFKSLVSFPLFHSHVCNISNSFGKPVRVVYEYAMDFGEDYEGAARLLSEIAIKSYGCAPNQTLEYHTNNGEENIARSRKVYLRNIHRTKVTNILLIIWILGCVVALIIIAFS
jgi:hypothetical protein